MTRRRTLLVALLLTAAAVLFLLLRGKPKSQATAEALPAAPSSPAPSAPAIAPPPDIPAPTKGDVEKQLELYKKAAVYPHWSLPLRPEMKFMLKWNEAVAEDTLFGDNPSDGLHFRFGADRAHVMVGEPYNAWLEVWQVDADGQKTLLPVRFESAAVQKTEGPDQGNALDLSFGDDGRHHYSTQFVPSQESALANATTARIVAIVSAGGQKKQLIRDFSYAPRKVLDVIGIRESIRDGSLVVTLTVHAYEEGVFTFYANLMAADGETPIASSKLSYPLHAGRGTADLIFFGKIIRDLNVGGPYVVRDIHGLRRGGSGENGVVFSDGRAYTTKPYKPTDFSDAEWDSEEKRERIKHFERLISSMGDQGGTKPAPIGR